MRDAFGGLLNIVIIVVFLVIVSGYLAFNVNYTKAFRVKNKIISTFEEREGNCENLESACAQEIFDYMEKIGYAKNTPSVPGFVCNTDWGFCYKKIESGNKTEITDNHQYYYSIVTQITIDIPIINKVMSNLNTFQIRGDTKNFTVRAKGKTS